MKHYAIDPTSYIYHLIVALNEQFTVDGAQESNVRWFSAVEASLVSSNIPLWLTICKHELLISRGPGRNVFRWVDDRENVVHEHRYKDISGRTPRNADRFLSGLHAILYCIWQRSRFPQLPREDKSQLDFGRYAKIDCADSYCRTVISPLRGFEMSSIGRTLLVR